MNPRKHGDTPFCTALIHGGPGAPGTMAPLARMVSCWLGVLEPLQTAASVEGQVQELARIIVNYAELPVNLVGHSWGAWLGFIFAARYPRLVRKLILVGSGPFKDEYVSAVMATRFARMSKAEREEAEHLMALLESQSDDTGAFARLGSLMGKADSFAPIAIEENISVQRHVYRGVWPEAQLLRKKGELLCLGRRISCPVLAIHGIYDPHPYQGVIEPLQEVLTDFRFILIEECGHVPWQERYARRYFLKILKEELG